MKKIKFVQYARVTPCLKGLEAWNSQKYILTKFRLPPEGSVNFKVKWGPRRIKFNLFQYARVIPCLKALEIWSSNR